MKKVIVIGGGASGLMAAYAAAERGNDVTLVEKNEKLGKKIYITGKGRCNLTNDCAPDDFLRNVVRGGKFLTGAVYAFSPADVMQFMERNGLQLKVERGNRVFPASDHASDVTRTLERACLAAGVQILLNTAVTRLEPLSNNLPLPAENTNNLPLSASDTDNLPLSASDTDKLFPPAENTNNLPPPCVKGEGREGDTPKDPAYASPRFLVHTSAGALPADAVIVATGGLAYPSTGSTGDGYRFAEDAGHTLVPRVPSLVGIELKKTYPQGVTLKNVVLTAKRGEKVLSSRLGELLFTHYGVSGPLVLTLSAEVNRLSMAEISLSVDFKPALDGKTLDARLVRDFAERKNERMKNVMRGLLPASLCAAVLEEAAVSPEKQANAVTREERTRLVQALKSFPLVPAKLCGFEEAVITSGGVSLSEVDPKTMESKKTRGLYFCGEVLDVDAYTGGFNLQIAFSTGYAAGTHIK